MSKNKLLLIAGPCAIENAETPYEVAEKVSAICKRLDIDLVFKSSYKKANRTRLDSFTGIGKQQAYDILQDIRKKYGVPVLTDIHESYEADELKDVVDYLQIPAFLCRQTDLLLAAGQTGLWVNIKKGQFAAPESMQFAAEKVRSTGNQKVLLTERGTTFGYQDLVVDFRSIPIMKQFAPVIMDCTHSLQQPNQTSGVTGGKPELIATIAKAAMAVGADGLFIETHPNPAQALSDGQNMLQLDRLEELLEVCLRVREVL
jgi:2-dehydro-3-deoxyphosphooctonate aldolase (KDO 8-P synthase)